MQIAEIILRYFEVFLKWPVIILIVAIIFFSLFKEPISDFLRRIIKAEAYGARLEASNPSEQHIETKKSFSSKPENEIEEFIRSKPKEAVKEIIRLWNGYIFERTFNVIYGTQIDLLEHLSDKGSNGEKYVNLAVFYKEFITRAKFAVVQMADYLGYLKNSGFVEFVGEGSEMSVKIMPYGIDFLSYIKTNFLSMYKNKSL